MTRSDTIVPHVYLIGILDTLTSSSAFSWGSDSEYGLDTGSFATAISS